MPSINDIMEVAELLRSKPVICAEERCVAVRNRNATCRKCAEACVAGCIEIEQNQLTIHSEACVNCGVCAAVCPTEALVALSPLDGEIVAEAVEAWRRRCAHGAAEEVPAVAIACARAAAQKMADPDLYATVPCLGRIDEALLVEMLCADRTGDIPADAHTPHVISTRAAVGGGAEGFLSGPLDVLLVDGNCKTCRYGGISPYLDEAIASTRSLFDAFELPVTVERASTFPSDVLLEDDQQRSTLRGRERRSLVGDAKRFATSAAKATAEKAIADALDQRPGEPTLRERLKVNPHGVLPTFPAERNMTVLDALCETTADPDALPDTTLDTRLFGDVTIDPDTCTGCGMCAMFCPTGALRFSDVAEHPEDGMRYLEFQAADCTQCDVCADVCLHHSVTVSPQVQLREVLDFEPRLIAVPQLKKTVDIFRLKDKYQKQGAKHGA